MKAFFANLAILLVLSVCLGLLEEYQESFEPLPQEYIPEELAHEPPKSPAKKTRSDFVEFNAPSGYLNSVEIINTDYRVFEYEIQRKIKRWNKNTDDHILTWSYDVDTLYAITAMGLDNKHHFSNHYLVGYEPFKTDKVWEPLYTLAMRKKYQLDHINYPGRQEIWQNSYEAFQFTRGDCEDHAIALADWLIAMGEDARVVAGDYDGGGHAWVVLFRDGKAYLLEATEKSRIKRGFRFPRAERMTKYHPEFMFNRDYFWVNSGSKFTTNYKSEKWEKRSFFSRVKNL